MAVDFGLRRLGIAVADPSGLVASPAATIEAGGRIQRQEQSWEAQAVAALREVVAREGVSKIVVGLPRTLSGEESESTRAARRFARALEQAVSVPIVLWDERLSTREALRRAREFGLSERRARPHLEAQSAAIVLQSYLDSQRRAETASSEGQ